MIAIFLYSSLVSILTCNMLLLKNEWSQTRWYPTASLSAERCKLFNLLSTPCSLPLWCAAGPAHQQVLSSGDMIMYLGRSSVHTSLCVYERMCMRASRCVLDVGKEPARGTLDRRYIPFFFLQRKGRLQNATRLPYEACENALCSPLTPSGKPGREPPSYAGSASLIFTVLLKWHLCRLPACADGIPTRCSSSFPG